MLVSGREASGHLNNRGDRLVQCQWPPREAVLERLSLVVGHHNEDLAVGGLIDLVDVRDIGVIER